jgi:3D (Asp-Asp-Asp) domain-containing protein
MNTMKKPASQKSGRSRRGGWASRQQRRFLALGGVVLICGLATTGMAPAASSAGSPPRDLKPYENTYYYFPKESDFKREDLVPIHDQRCEVIREVPRAFFEQLALQGSGRTADGRTVSYASHNCECPDGVDANGHSFCFDVLSKKRFPWGRGALGTAITPLRTIAVDRKMIPLGTPVFISDYVGAPTLKKGEEHDGCFVASDVGGWVRGNHIDVFTGDKSNMRKWNKLVPTRDGISVQVDAPQCQYLVSGA